LAGWGDEAGKVGVSGDTSGAVGGVGRALAVAPLDGWLWLGERPLAGCGVVGLLACCEPFPLGRLEGRREEDGGEPGER
jgi:hypothetical protein